MSTAWVENPGTHSKIDPCIGAGRPPKICGQTHGSDCQILSTLRYQQDDLTSQDHGSSPKKLYNVRHPCLLRLLTLRLLLESLANEQALLSLDIEDALFNGSFHDQAPDRRGACLSETVDASEC